MDDALRCGVDLVRARMRYLVPRLYPLSRIATPELCVCRAFTVCRAFAAACLVQIHGHAQRVSHDVEHTGVKGILIGKVSGIAGAAGALVPVRAAGSRLFCLRVRENVEVCCCGMFGRCRCLIVVAARRKCDLPLRI